jgi:hypothetical protein
MAGSNYTVILGDVIRKVEMGKDGQVSNSFRREFEIEGVDSGASSIVTLMVKGLTGESSPVNVELNGQYIGKILPYPNASAESWFMQTLHFSPSEGSLNPNQKNDSTTNVLEIPSKLRKNDKPEKTNQFDKFYLQNIVCFYKPQ